MVVYLIIQTIVLSIAAAFLIYGEYQSNDYVVVRRRRLFVSIGGAILLIFMAALFAIFVITIKH